MSVTKVFSRNNTVFYVKAKVKRCINTGSAHDRSSPLAGLMNFEDIPGPKSYPVIGTLYKYLPFIGDYNADALDKNAEFNWSNYGPLVREVLFNGTGLLHVFDPEDIEAVFRQDGAYPSRRSHLAMLDYRMRKPDVYNTGGLLATNGPEWWNLRSKFQKNFTSPKSIKEHIGATDEIVQKFLQWMTVNKIKPTDDFLLYLNRLNLEVVGKIAFNERFDSFSPQELNKSSRSSRVIEAAFGSNSGIMKLDKGFLWRLCWTPLYDNLAKSQEYLERVAKEILVNRLNFFGDESEELKNCLLGSFINQPDVDMKDILGMMVDILMASIDTTANSTSFLLYHLAKNPDVQEQLYQEVSRLLPNTDSPITAAVLTESSYAKNCVKESLRLNPVSIGIGRVLQKEIVLKEYLIPEGTVIVTQNMLTSRLPPNVKDGLKYKPERWIRSSTEYENIHPFMSLPFGFGPRSCIARRLAEQNMRITLIRILRNYQVKWTGENLGVKTFLINKPDKPVCFEFVPRC